MKKTIKIMSIIMITIVLLSIANTCFARMTEEEPEDTRMLVETKEEGVAITTKQEKKTVDYKLIIGIIVVVIVIFIAVISLVVIVKKRKIK